MCTKEVLEENSGLIDRIDLCEIPSIRPARNFLLTQTSVNPAYTREQFENQKQACLSAKVDILSVKNAIDAELYYCDCPSTQTAANPLTFVTRNNQTVKTPSYLYKPQAQNPLLFEGIEVFDKKKSTFRSIALDSSFFIQARVWPFLTLNFGPEDITTKIISTKEEQFSLLNRYSFFLKLLGFDIEMNLNSNAIFFENAVQIPMIFSFPVVPKKWLKENSGLLYTWVSPSPELKFDWGTSTLPRLNHPEPSVFLMNDSRSPCNVKECAFTLRGNVFDRPFSISWVIPYSDAKEGFYPQFVENITEFAEVKKWDLFGKPQKSKALVDSNFSEMSAVYFDISNLERKHYQWQFWISIGQTNAMSSNTASPAYVRPSHISTTFKKIFELQ